MKKVFIFENKGAKKKRTLWTQFNWRITRIKIKLRKFGDPEGSYHLFFSIRKKKIKLINVSSRVLIRLNLAQQWNQNYAAIYRNRRGNAEKRNSTNRSHISVENFQFEIEFSLIKIYFWRNLREHVSFQNNLK